VSAALLFVMARGKLMSFLDFTPIFSLFDIAPTRFASISLEYYSPPTNG